MKKNNRVTPPQILVSAEDQPLLDAGVWSIRRGKPGHTSYAVRILEGRNVRLHRLIMQPSATQQVDHINGNGLDNRRENLRICNRFENMRNSNHSRGASKFKGTAKHHNTGKWRSYIWVEGRQKHLGYFVTEVEAAQAYNKAALAYFGEYAKLNEC